MTYKSTDKDIIGPYVVWVNNGYEGWRPTSYNTLKEALEGQKFSEWCITKIVDFDVTERE